MSWTDLTDLSVTSVHVVWGGGGYVCVNGNVSHCTCNMIVIRSSYNHNPHINVYVQYVQYIPVFSPGHFRVSAHYAFILEGVSATTP